MGGFNFLLSWWMFICFGELIIIFGMDVLYGFFGDLSVFLIVVVVVIKNWLEVFYYLM